MDAQDVFRNQWPYLLSYLPSSLDLEATAAQTGALRRKRQVDSASTLLRLALAYGFCGLSLRQTAAWAEAADVASLSDVALLKRFRRASPWLAQILGSKLAAGADAAGSLPSQWRLRLADATGISRPGSTGTDWRLHLGYDLGTLSIVSLELTDASGGETLSRFTLQPGEIIIADRGYAHRRGLCSVIQSGAHFIVRLNWQNLPLLSPDGSPFSIISFLRALPDAAPGACLVQTAPDPVHNTPSIPCRLVALRKTEAAAAASREHIIHGGSKKRRSTDPRTLEAAGYTFLLTSAVDDSLTPTHVLELYRFRWQIELAASG
jgi:hypothetical protein